MTLNRDVMFSSGKDDWETPKDLFDKLNEEFGFTLDACATDENAKCPHYFTEDTDGLLQDWQGQTVYCNPPYSLTGGQDKWVKKCWEESQKPNTTVVALLPARTDTIRFHEYIWGKAEVRFIKGRVNFEVGGRPVLNNKGKPQPAPFPSMIVIWRPDKV